MTEMGRNVRPPSSADGERLFENPEALSRLRRDAFETVDVQCGIGILYGLGFADGLKAGVRLLHQFQRRSSDPASARTSGNPLLFRPTRIVSQACVEGVLPSSCESGIHVRDYESPPDDPICFVSAGFAAGWYSALLDETILVRETDCTARGDRSCHFEARPLTTWQEKQEPWVDELLAYLDFPAMRSAAEQAACEAAPSTAEDEEEGDMFGGFDAMSPAVHVWGPVMVLPYSGVEDCLAAISTVCEDLGEDQIRVVVLDVTGAKIDAIEGVGLRQLLVTLETRQMETVLVGMNPNEVDALGDPEAFGPSIAVNGISEGITLGFQLSQGAH